jgi:hypothetical protein
MTYWYWNEKARHMKIEAERIRGEILDQLRTGAKTSTQLSKAIKPRRRSALHQQLDRLIEADYIKATGKSGRRIYLLTKISTLITKKTKPSIDNDAEKMLKKSKEEVKIDELRIEINLLKQTIHLALNHMRAGQPEHAKAVLSTIAMTGRPLTAMDS